MLMRFKSSGPWWNVEKFDQVIVGSDSDGTTTTWHLSAGSGELATFTTEAQAQAALQKILDQVGSEDLA